MTLAVDTLWNRTRLVTLCATVLLAWGPLHAQELESRDRATSDPIMRDLVTAKRSPHVFLVDLNKGEYEVEIVMGDPEFPQKGMRLSVDGRTIADQIATKPGRPYRVTVPFTSQGETLAIEFSGTDYWVVNAITIRRGKKERGRYDFGTPDSPVAGKWTRVTHTTVYGEGRAYGWKRGEPVPELKKIKTPDTGSAAFPTRADYMIALERFPLYAERGWHASRTAGQPGYFGDPSEGEMGMRSMGNFIFTYALLGTDPSYDASVSGVTQTTLLGRARECLDYMCRTHVTGDMNRPTGKKWGNHWQSAWWTVRMLAGAKVMWNSLDEDERRAVERVAAHEASRHLDRRVPSGAASNTRAEENAWDAEVLAWAPSMFPGHPDAPRWRDKAMEFWMNTLSTPADRKDARIVDGRNVKDWVYTENIWNDYTIENHGAYHFCYMACPLHSAAWAWYGYRANGATPPASLFHHYRDVFGVIRRTWLDDGRFAYMAGKDWPRYAYGLYFIMPALVTLEIEDTDSVARLFERERFRLFEWESRRNKDGSFFGPRFTRHVMAGRLLEYETDCAANLALCYLLHGMKAAPKPAPVAEFKREVSGAFVSRDSQLALVRDGEWFSSWAWRGLNRKSCVGLVVPAGAGDMAEWAPDQFLASFEIAGVPANKVRRRIAWNDQAALDHDRGIAAIGVLNYEAGAGPLLESRIAFAALTPLHCAVVFNELRATASVSLSSAAATTFQLPNDIFNEGRRQLAYESGNRNIAGPIGTDEVWQTNSRWINIDDKLGLVAVRDAGATAPVHFVVHDRSERNLPWGSLLCESIECGPEIPLRQYAPGEVVRRAATLIVCGDSKETARLAASVKLALLATGNLDLVAMRIPGPAGREFIVTANFGDTPADVSFAARTRGKTQPPRSVTVHSY